MIYFVQVGTSGPIKIGFAADPAMRLAALQTAHYEALRLLLALDGDPPHENLLHKKFSFLRLRGEWYRPARELLAFIASPEPFPATSEYIDVLGRSASRPRLPALAEAIRRKGGVNELARAIGITPQAISQWGEVPPLQVIAVERATGVSRQALRPALYPDAAMPSSDAPGTPAAPSAADPAEPAKETAA